MRLTETLQTLHVCVCMCVCARVLCGGERDCVCLQGGEGAWVCACVYGGEMDVCVGCV